MADGTPIERGVSECRFEIREHAATSPVFLGEGHDGCTTVSVATNDVTIDLNGFSVRGPTVFTGSPTVTSCAPLGGNGIDAAGWQSVSVMNGTIRGMGNHGITLDDGSVDQVKAVSNGAAGIIRLSAFGWFTSIVSRSMANSNGTNGISGLGVVSDSTANFNGQTGIFATAAVNNCGAIENGGIGILAPFATVHNSTARSNDGVGINAHVITNSMASNNVGIGISGSRQAAARRPVAPAGRSSRSASQGKTSAAACPARSRGCSCGSDQTLRPRGAPAWRDTARVLDMLGGGAAYRRSSSMGSPRGSGRTSADVKSPLAMPPAMAVMP